MPSINVLLQNYNNYIAEKCKQIFQHIFTVDMDINHFTGTSKWFGWHLKLLAAWLFAQPFQRKLQRSASLPFVRGIHHWPVDFPHNGLVIWKMLPFYSVNHEILICFCAKMSGSMQCSQQQGSNYFHITSHHITNCHQLTCLFKSFSKLTMKKASKHYTGIL